MSQLKGDDMKKINMQKSIFFVFQHRIVVQNKN